LHSALMTSAPPGIVNQMTWEQQAADRAGLNWKSVLFCNSSPVDSPIILKPDAQSTLGVNGRLSWLGLRQAYYAWLSKEQSRWDLILLRHSSADPLQISFMRRYGHKTILVHHTKEEEEIRSGKTLKSYVKALVENYSGVASLGLARGVVAVTPEILNYQVSRVKESGVTQIALTYPNGIFLDDDSTLADLRGENPELLFVAGYFAPWHGLDRVLSSLGGVSDRFTLHLVGEISHQDKALISGDSRVRLHGFLDKQQIRQLLSQCWIGLSSFALDRKGMKQACTLKVREYLSHGLPVYAGYQEVFPENFAFYRQGKPDVRSVLAYAHEMRRANRMAVRNAAAPLISKEALLVKFYADLCASFK